jgi:cobalt-zinc-cadmium efflux system protein
MLGKVDDLAKRVRTILLEKFKIDHPTLQFESNTCNNGTLLCSISENNH